MPTFGRIYFERHFLNKSDNFDHGLRLCWKIL